MSDIWIRADYPIGPFAQQPIEQAVADVLAKAPWAAWQTGEVAFRYEYLDRPEAGTALLAILSPPHRPAPPDGLRYFVPDSPERRTVTQHTVACPTSVATPTQNQSIQVELECYTSYQGHFPPTSRDHVIPPNSPELRLTRFRKRWRILNGQYPALWFFWWGRDEYGGAGAGPTRLAPAGWDRTPVRAYPIARDPNLPTAPLFPFPSPARSSELALGPNAGGGIQSASNSHARPESRIPASAQAGGLEARQAYFAQQQQQHLLMQQQAQARGLNPASANQPLGYNMTPAQMQQAQLLAQQRYVAQQQQAAAHAANPQGRPPPQSQTPASRKSALPAPSASAAAGPSPGSVAGGPLPFAPPSREPILDSTTPNVDVLDVITCRQLAMHRLAVSQECLAPVFDAWTTRQVLAGHMRKRQVDDAVRTDAADPRTGESKGGIAGFGREHTLTILGTSAARIAVHAAMGKDVSKATFPVEERRDKLTAMLERIRSETEAMEKRHEDVVASYKAKRPRWQ